MENIAISVIVPVYGVEKYIGRCVRSLFGQTMTEGVEFIFVNDCTKDRSMELLNSLIGEYPQVSPQVKIIHHQRNRGLAAARQTGLDAARGEYILHLDSDDFSEHDMLEVMYQAALAKDADVVVSDFFWTFEKGDVYQVCHLSDSREEMLKSIIAPWKYGNRSVFPSLWNKLIRRSLYSENGIRSVEGINHGEDFIVTTQIMYHASVIAKVDRAFQHYFKQNPGAYTQDKSASNLRQRLMATDVVADFLSSRGSVYDEELDEKRFKDKLIAIANCDNDSLPEFLAVYPWLEYEKHKHLVPGYWRLPYKLALQGKTGRFLFLRNIIRSISKMKHALYDH